MGALFLALIRGVKLFLSETFITLGGRLVEGAVGVRGLNEETVPSLVGGATASCAAQAERSGLAVSSIGLSVS